MLLASPGTIRFFFTFLMAISLLFKTTKAQFFQQGLLDTTFNFGGVAHSYFAYNNTLPGAGSTSIINALAVQTDGKLLMGGVFLGYNGMSVSRIARLNTDGNLDTTFNRGTGPNQPVQSLAVQSDGKLVIVGNFTSFNGITRNRIARLNVDGSLDTTFNPGTGANTTVDVVVLQPDGKLIIGGSFISYNGRTRNSIARIHTDGSLDTTFNPGSGANFVIRTIALQPDGKLIIGGAFTIYNGTARNRIARLDSTGSLDLSFSTGTGTNDEVRSVAIQPDGKMLIGGWFSSYNGTTRSRIARLNANGSLDMTFNPGTGANAQVFTLSIQPDGKVIIGGLFEVYNGTARSAIARINQNGSLDTTFNPGTGASNVYALGLQADGKLFIGGWFSAYNGIVRNNVTRVNSDGSLDNSFNPVTGANGGFSNLVLQPDGKAIVVGAFSTFNGRTRNGIARLNPDGGLDLSFDPGAGAILGRVSAVALQSDGKVVIGGLFLAYNGISRNRMARIHADGSLDTTFNPGTGANGEVRALVIQADGKVIIGGDFSFFNGTSRMRIARLNVDGSIDTTFNPGIGVDGFIYCLALQPDGKIIIGGSFTGYNGTFRNYIARLNTNGSLDASFNPGSGANNLVRTVALQPDGKILLSGMFTTLNGSSRNRLARLNTNGSLDATFNPGAGANDEVHVIGLQANNQVLIGGIFTTFNGNSRNRIARLNTNGSLDTTFNPGLGANFWVMAFGVQADGRLLLGGGFSSYNGIYKPGLARVFSPNCTNTITNTTSTTTICVGSTKDLIGTPGGSWVIASGPGSITGSTYTASGGSGTVLVYNLLGSCPSVMVTFTVDSFPSAPLAYADTICSGNTFTITPTGVGIYRFYANPSGGLPLTSGNGVASFTTPVLSSDTSYYIASVSAGGCESITRSLFKISVNPLPLAPSVPAAAAICEVGTATLTPTAGGAAYRFYADSTAITPLAGGDSVLSFITPTLSSSTTYYISSISAAGCESNSRTAVGVTVYPLPVVNIVQLGDTLKADTASGDFQWFRDGLAINGATSQTYIPGESGVFSVTLTSPQGCVGRSNEINVIVTSLEEQTSNAIHWTSYPVPFREQLNIQAASAFSYQLLDVRGAVLRNGFSEEAFVTLLTGELISGIYLLKITTSGQTTIRKLLRE